jgi:ribosome-associated translation inhibitor RaiA
MASIRDLKSDVKYLVSEIVSDCSNVIVLHPEKKDDVLSLIEKALDILDSSLNKINDGRGKDKAYFNAVKDEAIVAADAIYNQLREIIGAK